MKVWYRILWKEVVARMQLSGTAQSAQHGVFNDMKPGHRSCQRGRKNSPPRPMDQREQIVSNIRKKTHEAAEILARMGVEETGMGNVGDKIPETSSSGRQNAWYGRYYNNSLVGRQRAYPD